MSPVEEVVCSSTAKKSQVSSCEFIAELLASPVCPAYTMNMEQLDGYLRAVAAEPRDTCPKDWMPLIFGGEFPCFIYGYSTDTITNALICLYNSHRAEVLRNECTLSFPYEFSEDRTARIQAEQWARGFMQAIFFGRIFGVNI
jgi:yecA family protein